MVALTQQTMFDFVMNFLLDQGKRSIRKTILGRPICCLRAKDGSRCAIGSMITDEHYNESLENAPPLTGEPRFALEQSIGINLVSKEFNMLRRLMNAHDDYEPKEWERLFRRIANEYSLEWNRIIKSEQQL